jgi:uncharacterized protein YggU (UPF0235/DUF167 family)
VTLRVKVIPRCPKSEIAGTLSDGTLKVRLAAVPEKGKANDALIDLLARHYNVPRASIQIISGHASQLKLVRIH